MMVEKAPGLAGEIRQQPDAFKRLLEGQQEHAARIAGEVAGRFDYVFIAARGSSDNAARYAQYLFGAENRLPVGLATPSLFSIYKKPPRLNGAFVIGISQSGQSPDVVAVIAEARRQGRPTLAVTNEPDSPLAAAAEFVIDIHAGAEKAVAATKTYTNSLGALALLSCSLSGSPARLKELHAMPDLMASTLQATEPLEEQASRYRAIERCAVIGRGYNYSTAFEIALKIKELTRVAAEPYSSADFRHGPIAIARDGFPVVLVAPGGALREDVAALKKDLALRGCSLLVISDQVGLLAGAQVGVRIPQAPAESLSPILAVLPGQVFSMALARARGLDPDRPAGLDKVTRTR